MDVLADRNLFDRRFFAISCPVIDSGINSSFLILNNSIDIQSFGVANLRNDVSSVTVRSYKL